MPRRRHEEERSSTSRSPPPPTERRSPSSPRPAAARSRSRENTGRSAPRPSPRPAPATAASTPRSSPQPRPAPATAPVAASAPRSLRQPRPAPAPACSSSPRTERSTRRTYRASSDDSNRARSDDEYSLFGGILSGMRRASNDDQASSNDRARARATSHGESLFGDTIRILLCPSPPVVSEPVAVPVSPCDTQTKAFQDCLHEFETDISKCQLYMNTLSRCKKNSDSKLDDVVRGMPRASSDSESRFLTFVRDPQLYCAHELWWSVRLPLLAPVAAPVAGTVSLCDTQDQAFQDCLHDFETDISKCQLYMNMYVVSMQEEF